MAYIVQKMKSCVWEAYSNGCTWIVRQSNKDIYEVHLFPMVLVDIGKRSCSCFQWQLNGFPCAHAVVAIQNSGKDFSTCVEQFFTSSNTKQLIPNTFSQYQQLTNRPSRKMTSSYIHRQLDVFQGDRRIIRYLPGEKN